MTMTGLPDRLYDTMNDMVRPEKLCSWSDRGRPVSWHTGTYDYDYDETWC